MSIEIIEIEENDNESHNNNSPNKRIITRNPIIHHFKLPSTPIRVNKILNSTNYIYHYINYISKCININHIYEPYTHFYLITTFEIIFYFNYIVAIEKQLIKKRLVQFGKFIQQNINYQNYIDDDNYFNIIDNYCQDFNENWVYKYNQTLKDNSLWFIFINTFIFFIFTFIHYLKNKEIKTIIHSIQKSAFFILIIGIFEFLFFYYIVLNYHIMDNYQSTCIILNTIN